MSKNVEATWERRRSYEEWRESLPGLSADTYQSLPFVENSASLSGAYPYFDIHCVVFPRVLNPGTFSTAQLAEAANNQAAEYERHRGWLTHLETPVIATAINYELTTFAIKNIIDKSESIVNRATFVKDVIRQRFKAGRDTTVAIDDEQVPRYSTWHRKVLTTSSYVVDVNYVELRNRTPKAVIERTQVTHGDLERNFFNFMTRGYAQGMVVLQVAERLGVKCFLSVYEQDMSRLLVVELNREVVELSKPLLREREQLSNQFQRKEGLPRNFAQGKATQALYDKYEGLRKRMLDATTYSEYSSDEYRSWLEEL